MRDRLRQLVEPVVFLVAPALRGGELQHARLHRHRHGGQRDAVLVGEVGDRLHVRIVRHEVVRQIAERRDALHVLPAMRAVPDRQQRTDARAGDIDRAGQQRIVDGRAARQFHPVDLDVEPLFAPFLLDQLLVACDVEQQIDDAELLGNADLAFGMRRRGGAKAGSGNGNGHREQGGRKTAREQRPRRGRAKRGQHGNSGLRGLN